MTPKFFFASGACSLASHIALIEAGADFEPVRIDLATGEQRDGPYLAINPKGRVPAVVTDQGLLSENPAILDWIARTWPEAALAPLEDDWAMAQVTSFNTFIASSVHVGFANLFRPERYAEATGFEALKTKTPGVIEGYFGLIEEKLSPGPWVHGKGFTVSDPYLYVMSRWFLRDRPGRRSRFAQTAAHLERMQARAATLRALEYEGLTPI